MSNFRIGMGYDVHPLVAGRPLIIGGCKINYHKGADGHSDADVLTHAICDALLGAANLGDIGSHFPDNDSNYKNANSLMLLASVVSKLKKKAYRIVNIDTTVCLQNPKIKNHISSMAQNIAVAADIPAENISVKATTTEKLGFIGKGKGISAYAVAMIEKISN